MTPSPNTPADVMEPKEQEIELLHEVADAVGALMEFWGFKRVMGRVWSLLYLRGEPLSAAELCEQLNISSGAASMTLSELEHWGVVKRSRKPGDRREYFEAPGMVGEHQRAGLAEIVQVGPAVLGEDRAALDAGVDIGLAGQVGIDRVEVDGDPQRGCVPPGPSRSAAAAGGVPGDRAGAA